MPWREQYVKLLEQTQDVVDPGYGSVGFTFYPIEFQSCFGSVLFYPLCLLYGIGMLILCHCVSMVFNFILLFAEAHS